MRDVFGPSVIHQVVNGAIAEGGSGSAHALTFHPGNGILAISCAMTPALTHEAQDWRAMCYLAMFTQDLVGAGYTLAYTFPFAASWYGASAQFLKTPQFEINLPFPWQPCDPPVFRTRGSTKASQARNIRVYASIQWSTLASADMDEVVANWSIWTV